MHPIYLINVAFIASIFVSSLAYAEPPQGGIYWASPSDAVAAGMERCKHFDTPSLEDQKDRLTKKYGSDLKDAIIQAADDGVRVFTAVRHNQETNEDIKYTYFDSLNACEDFQSKALQGSVSENEKQAASVSIANAGTITVPCSNGGGSGGWMFGKPANLSENMFPLEIIEVKELPQGSKEEKNHPDYDEYIHPGDPDYDGHGSFPRHGYCTISPATPKQANTQQSLQEQQSDICEQISSFILATLINQKEAPDLNTYLFFIEKYFNSILHKKYPDLSMVTMQAIVAFPFSDAKYSLNTLENDNKRCKEMLKDGTLPKEFFYKSP